LETNAHINTYKISAPTSGEGIRFVSIIKAGHVMLFKEVKVSGQLHAPFSLPSIPTEYGTLRYKPRVRLPMVSWTFSLT
jgi:hypothetical protein